MSFGDWVSNATNRLYGLPLGVKVVAGVAVVAVLAVGSVLMYRTYDFVQHDNQFCLECHLMADPYEQFARSAHRGLGCKACHRPNIIERSEMGLAQIVESPDSIRVHAHVPNRICAECHIEGDPDEWRRVANTAGHRVHLESDDPALQGLNCVECHSTGVHQFTPTDQTCGQGGCHEDTEIRLGRMADLTIHCATCHDFATPVAPRASTSQAASQLSPDADACLACHQMRSILGELPPDEPHGAECGVCHNPHEQNTPAEAVLTCASGGCHSEPASLTPQHRGLNPGVLDDCTACHEAHTFRIHGDGQDCLSCHQDIYEDAPPGRVGAASTPVRLASAGPVDPALARLALAAHAPAPVDTAGFWHAQHRDVECTACHTMEGEHGALTVTSIADCRGCHHAAPVATDCSRCHARPEMLRRTFEVPRTMEFSAGAGRTVSRDLPFDHEAHVDLGCAMCHNTGGLSLQSSNVQCNECHEQHHNPNADCMACHVTPPAGAHNLESHLTCAGAGCHQAATQSVKAVPRTRDFCLVCHQDLTSHRPGRSCEHCHVLPRPQTALGSDRPDRPPLAEVP